MVQKAEFAIPEIKNLDNGIYLRPFHPETKADMEALAILDVASSEAHDAFPEGDPRNDLPATEYRKAWAKGDQERALYGIFNAKGRAVGFTYVYPDDMWNEQKDYPVSKEVFNWMTKIPMDAHVAEMNFWVLDGTPKEAQVSAAAMRQTLAQIFSETPDNRHAGITHVMFYAAPEERIDQKAALEAGFEKRTTFHYQFETTPSDVFVATKESYRKALQNTPKPAPPKV